MTTRRHGSGTTSRGPKVSDYPFTVTVTPTARSSGGGTSEANVYDEVVTTVTNAGVTTESSIVASSSLVVRAPVCINLTPSIASLDASTGQLTRVADGTAVVNVASDTYIAQVNIPISYAASGSTSYVTGFATGSLAKHCYDWFSAAVSGKTASSTTMNFLAGDGSRSTTTWVGALDTSCILTANSSGWQQGALIAPRFAIIASHVGTSVGSTYSCRNNSGAEVVRTVTGLTSLGVDLTLVCFDSAFTGITPAKIFPANYATKYKPVPAMSLRKGVPIIKWKRNTSAWQIGIGIGNDGYGLSYTRPAAFADWYVEWISGDSGSPYGTVINGSFVFLGNAWSGSRSNDDGGSFLALLVSNLPAAMDALVSGSSSTLSFVDLSGFPSYS